MYICQRRRGDLPVKTEDMERFLSLCLAITEERDREALLSSILDTAMDLAGCDAGTLYLVEDDQLHFCRMVTRSQHVRQGGHDAPIMLPPIPMEERFVAAWAAIYRTSVRISDIRRDPRFDFSGSLQYDKLTGYETVSMMVVPLSSDRGELVGIMQLINALDSRGNVIPFDADMEKLIFAVASQAAISITNMQYTEQIYALMDSLVVSLSSAIDERSHYTANHTRNMVSVAERFLDWLNRTDSPWQFDADRRRAFLMSVWLHDVGKLAVPLKVMDKATRLGDALPGLLERFRVIGLLDRIAMLEGRLTEDELSRRDLDRKETETAILRINSGGFLSEADRAFIEELSHKTYMDETGRVLPWITEEEKRCLSIPKGTLTAEERQVMENHVQITRRILDGVSYPRQFASVPAWAAAHHEFLDGSGYPDHIGTDEIPPEARLLTILDIFEALTARDRPYKKAMPLEKALRILQEMAECGKLDAGILDLFLQSRAWEAVL